MGQRAIAGGSRVRRGAGALRLMLISLASLTFGAGCTSLHYLAQAGAGQLGISLATESLRDAVANPQTEPRVRDLLIRVPSIKRFGERQGLAHTTSYNSYAD